MEPIDLPSIVKDIERACIEVALNRTGGNIAKAARLLGLERTTLRAKVHTQNIQEPKVRPTALLDPEGEFKITRVSRHFLAVSWHDEVLKQFRTISAANEFLQEKINE